MKTAIQKIGQALLSDEKEKARFIFLAELQHLERVEQISRDEAIAAFIKKAAMLAQEEDFEQTRDAGLKFLLEIDDLLCIDVDHLLK